MNDLPAANNETETKPTNIDAETKPTKPQRNTLWERLVVRGGIVLLLLVVVLEWMSQRSYSSSLERLETQMKSGPFQLGDTTKMVQGYSFRKEFKTSHRKFVQLKWPSLFKKYEIWLTIVGDQQVLEVTTVSPIDDEFGPIKLDQQPSAPKDKRAG